MSNYLLKTNKSLFKYYLETFKQLLRRFHKPINYKTASEDTATPVSRETEDTVQELLNSSFRQTTSFTTRGIKGEMTRIEEC